MIRRGFWLLTGAALGVSGYRKASRLSRAAGGRADDRPAVRRGDGRVAGRRAEDRAAGRVPAPPWPVRLIAGTRAASGFVRDVRVGMAEYRDLSGREPGRSLGSQRDRAQPGAGERAHRKP
jgi:hypothetical protein